MKDELPKRLFHNGFISFVGGSILVIQGGTVNVVNVNIDSQYAYTM